MCVCVCLGVCLIKTISYRKLSLNQRVYVFVAERERKRESHCDAENGDFLVKIAEGRRSENMREGVKAVNWSTFDGERGRGREKERGDGKRGEQRWSRLM